MMITSWVMIIKIEQNEDKAIAFLIMEKKKLI